MTCWSVPWPYSRWLSTIRHARTGGIAIAWWQCKSNHLTTVEVELVVNDTIYRLDTAVVMFVMVISSTRRYARSWIRLALWFLIIKKDFVELPVIEASTRLDTTIAIVFMMVLNKKTCEERDRSVKLSRDEMLVRHPDWRAAGKVWNFDVKERKKKC